ncbi:MAG: SEC-C metal-binding domain-containing protein, partial [Chlamydiota bacterium]
NEVKAPYEDDADDDDIKIPPRNFSGIGRNDPCPCGSNKKFKKCCETKRSDPKLFLPYIPPISFEPTSDSIDDLGQEDSEMILQVLDENAPGENSDVVLPILFKLKEKYPHIPIFYHLIDDNYICNSKTKESLELLSICFKKFPDNILWKLKYADYLLRRGEYDKIEKLFQGKFTLQELYPEKASFYIEDFENFSRFVIIYFAKIGQIEKADLYFSAMKEFVSKKDLIEDLDGFIETCYQRQYLKKQSLMEKETVQSTL